MYFKKEEVFEHRLCDANRDHNKQKTISKLSMVSAILSIISFLMTIVAFYFFHEELKKNRTAYFFTSTGVTKKINYSDKTIDILNKKLKQ